uniref:CCT domain-containing protein n=1 Tax=Oryza punctata TaxID=4537 RepID=A0A0E0M8H5_ORYPU
MMMMFQDQDFIGMPPSAIYQFRAFLGARSIMLDDVDDEPFTDGISSPIAQHIYDFCDDGNGGDLFAAVSAAAAGSDMFTASSEDASASSSSTATAPIAGGDNLSPPLPMVMSMMGMDEIGEYQRMIECGGALLGGTHAADGADMTFGNAAATAEMQMGGSGSPARLPATGTTETSSLEDTSFKTVRLSNEERKEKIHRYIKKRNERNFSKKIKYACRKTLADSRPRVRGRFAKNDDYCEASRSIGSQNHEEYEQIGGVKGEDMIDSDALAHISGMSSYMYNHTVESWI